MDYYVLKSNPALLIDLALVTTHYRAMRDREGFLKTEIMITMPIKYLGNQKVKLGYLVSMELFPASYYVKKNK